MSARIHLLHEVITAHVGCSDRGELDRAGIVHDYVDAAKFECGLVEGSLHRIFVAYIDG